MFIDTIRAAADKAYDAADVHLSEAIVTIQAAQIAVDRLDSITTGDSGEAGRIIRTLSCITERAHREATAAADTFAYLLDAVMTNPNGEDVRFIEAQPLPEREAFAQQLSTYRAAKAAFDDYTRDRDNWNDAEGDRLCNQFAAEVDRLLLMPAPDAAALATKLDVAVTEEIAKGWNSAVAIMAALAADAKRIAA